MSLLTGIIGSTIPQTLSVTNTYDVSSTGSGGMSITGASAGNIYVLVQTVLKANDGASGGIASPSGFSGDGIFTFPGRFSYQISYKYLTSTEATISIPSVTNAQAQTAVGFVISDVNSSYTSLSNPVNDYGYLTSGDPAQLSTSVIFNDIAIGSFVVLDDASASFNGSIVDPFDAVGLKSVTSSGTGETIFQSTYIKIFDNFASDTASFDPGNEATPTLTSLNIVRPS
jgi:hypothetical protein